MNLVTRSLSFLGAALVAACQPKAAGPVAPEDLPGATAAVDGGRLASFVNTRTRGLAVADGHVISARRIPPQQLKQGGPWYAGGWAYYVATFNGMADGSSTFQEVVMWDGGSVGGVRPRLKAPPADSSLSSR